MSDFLKQINEDIEEYQKKYPNVSNIEKAEWAFNFWVLDKLYSIDDQLIEEQIVEYNDKGVDCYVWHEDTRDLYLIQNKFYSSGTMLSTDYIRYDFLVRAIDALDEGKYSRSPELQQIYTNYKDEPDFSIHQRLYVTNNNALTSEILDILSDYNTKYTNRDVKAFSLDDIEIEYFGEPVREKKKLFFDVKTKNSGTILNINTKDYGLDLNIDAKYVFTPILSLYELIDKARKEKYPIFDANIRDYLGATGTVNKGIVSTLKDSKERKNFFYYNNGITMIVKKVEPAKTVGGVCTVGVLNPQIVNGCQTVSTIYETLNSYPMNLRYSEFKDTYVMLKILEIPDDSREMEILNNNIVKFNNSQNAINQKTFVASSSEFLRLQNEFERKGLLICIKQSDKHTFSLKYPKPTELKNNNSELIKRFGIKDLNATKDYYIDLEKLLQVIVAFKGTPIDAIQNKSKLLKPGTSQNSMAIEFIKGEVSINEIVDLYLLYFRAEQEKKNNDKIKFNPFQLIYCFSRYTCNNGETDKIHMALGSEEEVNKILKFYMLALNTYYVEWKGKDQGKEYNDMIKSQMDLGLLDKCKEIVESIPML